MRSMTRRIFEYPNVARPNFLRRRRTAPLTRVSLFRSKRWRERFRFMGCVALGLVFVFGVFFWFAILGELFGL